jgi:hypothetical protein
MNSSDFYAEFKGKGLIFFSDPSAAKTALAFAYNLKRFQRNIEFLIFTNKEYSFFKEWELKINISEFVDEKMFESVDWVFTGTSHPESSNSFEIKHIKIALEKGIQIFSFVDQIANVKVRFLLNNKLYLPHKILVPDLFSANSLIVQEIPSLIIEVLENPYLFFIQQFWKSKISRTEFSNYYNFSNSIKKIIVYAPDPLTLRGVDKRLGFNEFEVFEQLINFLRSNSNFALLVKLHPLQENRNRFIFLKGDLTNIFIDFENKIDNLDLVYYSDYVIGFYSNFLIEASKLNENIIRYFPKNGTVDVFNHLKFGIKVNSYQELIKVLR